MKNPQEISPMSLLDLLKNLRCFVIQRFSKIRDFFFGPPPTPPIEVTIVHVTKITLEPKDTIDGVPITLPPEEFQAELAAAKAREIAVMKHNALSDQLLRNPKFGDEEVTHWFVAIAGGSSLVAIALGIYCLAPGLASLSLLSGAVSMAMTGIAQSAGLDPLSASLLSLILRWWLLRRLTRKKKN